MKQRNKPPGNNHSEKPTPKQDSWWTVELFKLPHLIEGGTAQAAATERQKKKTLPTVQPPGETATKLLLKYQPGLDAGGVTPELK
jgi:hypothetical protein